MKRSLVFLIAACSTLASLIAFAQGQGGPVPGAPVPGLPGPGAQRPGPPLPPRDSLQRPQTGTARVRGRVLAAAGSAPLRRAQVSLTAVDTPQLRRATTTDADGRYELVDLPAGRYQLTVTKAGYVTMQYGQRRPFEPGTPIGVRDGETVSSIDFALPKGAVIAVRLTDEFGEPVAGQTVQVQRFQWSEDGQRRLVGSGSGGTPFSGTDDRGEVRIYGLMPGEYVIEARRGVGTGGPGAGSDAAEGFATTFYPGTLSAPEAQPVTVGIGQELSIQFSLAVSRLSRIRGTAADSQGRPAAGAAISVVTPVGCGGFSSSTAGQVAPDGTFTVSGVAPGEHFLRFSLRRGVDTESAAVPLAVTGDIDGIAAVLGSGTTVTGRIVYEGTPPSAGQQGWPQLLRVTARESCQSLGSSSGGDVDPDNNFRITGAAGQVFFTVPGLPPTWMVKSVTLDGADITDVAMNVGDSRTVSDVRVTLTDKVPLVYGFVTGAKGQNLTDYVVVIQPADQKEPAGAARLAKAARPDTSGRFEVRGLRPGRYVATAIESMEQNRQFSPEFQKELRRGAREFTVKEGETLSLDLRLTAGL